MPAHHPDNERIKHRYFQFLKEAKRHCEDSVDAVAAALARFEACTGHRDFKAFHFKQAIAFKQRLAAQSSRSTGERLSKATQYATLAALKNFFQWLALQPGYKSRLNYTEADYFSLSEKDSRVATARRQRPVPTLEQVRHVILTMPAGTDIERRNRALLAFAMLTGARDMALASFKLKHVDVPARTVFQDAREVKTKFSKSFTTTFFPVGDDMLEIAVDWVHYLRRDRLWGLDDPLFPATEVAVGADCQFAATGLRREHWSTASPIRAIFRQAFEAAGLPYYNPHSLRSTLVKLGQVRCHTVEDFKAWSQNLGHEGVLTTLHSYGTVAADRQSEIIKQLGEPRRQPAEAGHVLEKVLQTIREAGLDTGA